MQGVKLENKHTIHIVIFSVSIAILHNIVLLTGSALPQSAKDSRFSSHIYQNENDPSLKNEIYDRINENAVMKQFYSTCRSYYEGSDITVPAKLFKEEDLKSAGFNNIILSQMTRRDPEKALRLLGFSCKSIWYNPIVFSPTDFKVLSRFPLVTQPSLSGDFPRVILFIEGDKSEKKQIGVVICERYIVFAPKEFLDRMEMVL